MKRISVWICWLGLFSLAMTFQALAENNLLEKIKNEALEKFVVSSRKSDGDYSTISIRNWRNEPGIPLMSTEDMIRKVLSIFEEHYKNLKITNYLVVYSSKPGGGIESDFLLIHHELKPQKVYKFGTKLSKD